MTAETAILGTTLGVAQKPGTNLAPAADGSWRFLLPTLEPRHAVCLDPPGRPQLLTLSRLAERVTVQGDPRRVRRVAATWTRDGGSDNVDFRPADGDLDPDVDLVVSFGRRSRERIHRARGQGRADVTFVAVWRQLVASAGHGEDGRRAPDGDPMLWLRPPFGSVTAAARAEDDASIRWLCAGGHDRSREGFTVGRKVLRRVLDHDGVRRHVARRAVVLGPEGDGQLPAYIQRSAARSGLDLGQDPWAMSAPARYRSKKVVFFVFDPVEHRLHHVVKVTRHRDLNHRLENEWSALRHLRQRGITGVPEPSFLDHHAGLALLGQSAVQGSPLRPTLDAAGADRAATVTRWLEDLAAVTVQRQPASLVAAALTRLIDRFDSLYRPAPGLLAVLREQVGAIAGVGTMFPVVFQHGDAGVWNAVDGRQITFLDWEAADPAGMPLWDLFYFMRSYGVGAARAAGTQDALVGFRRAYLEASPLSQHLAGAVRSYCARIGIETGLVEPLFHLCWLHRAVKEATRLSPSALSRGHYRRLLEEGLAGGGSSLFDSLR